jgi:4-hydroxybutyrate CoA-transferase
LLGQVGAEAVGNMAVSGPGGPPDFSFMARRSLRGCSIIALPSTDASGTRSRIVPALGALSPVSLSGTEVDYVVTEYGIAALRGKAVRGRMSALRQIAAPQFRDGLAGATDL